MAIVYSYPKVTSPLATDVLVLTDTTVTAGKRKNKTKSIAMSDVATYIINSKSGITGSGTLNTFPIFTASTIIGDSIITQAALGQGITVAGNFDVTNDTNLQGSLLADSLEVSNDSVFTGSARFNSTIKDTSGGVGTNGQVLTSTGTGVAWTTDAGGSVTGTGTTNYIAKWNTSSSIQDSIIFDNGTNVGIGTNSPNFLLDVEAQGADMRVFNLTSNANTDIYFRTTGTTGSSRILFGDSSDPSIGNIIYRHTSDSLAFTTNNSEKMRVLSNGNIGIGTIFPTEKLDIYSDGNAVVRLESAGGGVGVLDVGTDFTINNRINTNLIFKTSNTEKMRITNTGNVGIGTTSPTEKLEVSGNILIDSIGQELQFSNHSVGAYRDGSNRLMISGYGGIRFQAEAVGGMENQATRMVINPSGNVGIGTISPVAKLHVKVNDSGATPIAQQHLIVENNSATGIGILTPSATSGYLFFGDNNDAQRGFISYDHSSDSMAFKVSGSERMRIDSSGSVGIGTTSPSNKLHVNSGSTNEVARFESTDSVAYLSIMDNNTTYSLQGIGSIGDALTLYNNNSEKIRINSSGDVGIGTNSPTRKLDVAGDMNLASSAVALRIGGTGVLGILNNSTRINGTGGASGGIIFTPNDDNTERMRITGGGNVGIGTTSPSDKLHVDGSRSNLNGIKIGENSEQIQFTNDAKLFIGNNRWFVFGEGGAEFMRAGGASGRLGIGTSSPSEKLEVNGRIKIQTSAGSLTIKESGSASAAISGSATIVVEASSNFRLKTGPSLLENFTVLSTGDVGIGTTSPASKLAVDGGDIEVDDSASGLILRSPNGTRYRIQVDNSGNLTTTAV